MAIFNCFCNVFVCVLNFSNASEFIQSLFHTMSCSVGIHFGPVSGRLFKGQVSIFPFPVASGGSCVLALMILFILLCRSLCSTITVMLCYYSQYRGQGLEVKTRGVIASLLPSRVFSMRSCGVGMLTVFFFFLLCARTHN